MLKYLLIALSLITGTISAQAHNHAKHNMLVYGEAEIYASHLVYKVPHNYQVILKLKLPNEARAAYLKERGQNPGAEILFLLDDLDIGQIESAARISGTIFTTMPDGAKLTLAEKVELPREAYTVVYLNELPLSLERR